MDILRHGLLVVPVGGPRRRPHAAQVNGDDGVMLGERRHDLVERPPGLRPAGQQHQRFALAADDVVQPHAVDLGVAVPESG